MGQFNNISLVATNAVAADSHSLKRRRRANANTTHIAHHNTNNNVTTNNVNNNINVVYSGAHPTTTVVTPAATGSARGLPFGWIAHVDAESGDTFFHHMPTDHVQWEEPDVPPECGPSDVETPRFAARVDVPHFASHAERLASNALALFGTRVALPPLLYAASFVAARTVPPGDDSGVHTQLRNAAAVAAATRITPSLDVDADACEALSFDGWQQCARVADRIVALWQADLAADAAADADGTDPLTADAPLPPAVDFDAASWRRERVTAYNDMRRNSRRITVEQLAWPQLAKKWLDSDCVDDVTDEDVRADVLWARCASFPTMPGFDARSSSSMLWLSPFYSRRVNVPFDPHFAMCRNTGSPLKPDVGGDERVVGALPPDAQMYYDSDTQSFYYYDTTLKFSSWHRPHSKHYEHQRLATELARHTCGSTVTRLDSLGIVRFVHEDDCQLDTAGMLTTPTPPREPVACDPRCAKVKSTSDNSVDVNHAWSCRVFRAFGGIAAYHSNGPDAEQIANAGHQNFESTAAATTSSVAAAAAAMTTTVAAVAVSTKATTATVAPLGLLHAEADANKAATMITSETAGAAIVRKQRAEFGHHNVIRKANDERRQQEVLREISLESLLAVPNVQVSQVPKRPSSTAYRLYATLLQPFGAWTTLSASARRLYDLRVASLLAMYHNELNWLGLTQYTADLIRGLKLCNMPQVQPSDLQLPPPASALALLYMASDPTQPQPEWMALTVEQRQAIEREFEHQKEAYARSLSQLRLTPEQAYTLRTMYTSGIRPNVKGCADVGGRGEPLSDGHLWTHHVARNALALVSQGNQSVDALAAQLWTSSTDAERENFASIVRERRALYDQALVDASFMQEGAVAAPPPQNVCRTCQLAVPEHRMMQCVSCRDVCHCYCARPPLATPASGGQWVCLKCREPRRRK